MPRKKEGIVSAITKTPRVSRRMRANLRRRRLFSILALLCRGRGVSGCIQPFRHGQDGSGESFKSSLSLNANRVASANVNAQGVLHAKEAALVMERRQVVSARRLKLRIRGGVGQREKGAGGGKGVGHCLSFAAESVPVS